MSFISKRAQSASGDALMRLFAASISLAVLMQMATMCSAHAQEKNSQEIRYDACMGEAVRRPADAFDSANRWHDEGGGLPSRHCAAIALINLGQPAEAAARLGELARAPGSANAALRADLFAQSGNAWLLAGMAMQAVDMFTDALGLAPNEPQILTDRARAYVVRGENAKATDDLNRAIALAPTEAEAYVVRAGLRRKAGAMPLAREDITKALKIIPEHTGALLERGLQRQIDGDKEGARADWLKIISLAAAGKQSAREDMPANETLKAAQNYLEGLDVKGAAPPAP